MSTETQTFLTEIYQLLYAELEPEKMLTKGLEISIRKSGDVMVMDLRGRSTLNGNESELLSSRLRELIGGGARKFLLNLTHLTQLDSTGVSVIVRNFAAIRKVGGDLRLLRPSGAVLQVFNVLHLLEIIPNFGDEAEALASFQPGIKTTA